MRNSGRNGDFEQGDLFANVPIAAETTPAEQSVTGDDDDRELLPTADEAAAPDLTGEDDDDDNVLRISAPAAGEIPQTEQPHAKTVPMPWRKIPHRLNKKHGNDSFSAEEKLRVSHLLKEARRKLNLSPAQVEEVTKIRSIYLLALEDGCYDDLPHAVYVLAYLRKLCELYRDTGLVEEEVVRPWMNIQCEIPDNLPASVTMDNDRENKRQIRRMEIIIISAAGFILLLILTGIILIIASCSGSSGKPPRRYSSARVLKVQRQPALQAVPPANENHR